MILKTSSSHEESCERQWAILSKEFTGDKNGRVSGLSCIEVEWKSDPIKSQSRMIETPGSEMMIECDFVFLAMGYLHPQFEGLLEILGIKVDQRGNEADSNFQTFNLKVFTAGDMRRSQSLVVWAIAEGCPAADAAQGYLIN